MLVIIKLLGLPQNIYEVVHMNYSFYLSVTYCLLLITDSTTLLDRYSFRQLWRNTYLSIHNMKFAAPKQTPSFARIG